MRTEFLCVSVLRVASGPRVKLASCKSALTSIPPCPSLPLPPPPRPPPPPHEIQCSRLNKAMLKGRAVDMAYIAEIKSYIKNGATLIRYICFSSFIDRLQPISFADVYTANVTRYLLKRPYNTTLIYSRLSLSRIPRDSLKYFEISVPRHIRFAELRKNNLNNHI